MCPSTPEQIAHFYMNLARLNTSMAMTEWATLDFLSQDEPQMKATESTRYFKPREITQVNSRW